MMSKIEYAVTRYIKIKVLKELPYNIKSDDVIEIMQVIFSGKYAVWKTFVLINGELQHENIEKFIISQFPIDQWNAHSQPIGDFYEILEVNNENFFAKQNRQSLNLIITPKNDEQD